MARCTIGQSAQNAADRVNSQRTKLREVVKFRFRSGQRLKWPEIEVARVKVARGRIGHRSYWLEIEEARS